MLLTLVRHGQPEWQVDGLGVTDPGLTSLGHDQARAAADRLTGERVDAVLVSPLRRARQTAAPIADSLGLEAEVQPWLAEIASPPWDGTPIEHIEKIFDEQRRRSVEELWEGLDGGERFPDFHDRVASGLATHLASLGVEQHHDHPRLWQTPGDDLHVVVVAHGGTNAVLVGVLLGIPPTPWEWERFHHYHAAVSSLSTIAIGGAAAFSLRFLNDLSHLPADLRTF
jgi:probable phosphoglycerate mutase